MNLQKTYFYRLSLIFSSISIMVTLLLNYQIAQIYLKTSGKTRALFGIIELVRFSYQYLVVIGGITAFVFSILTPNTLQVYKVITLVLSIFAIVLVFLQTWRLFI